MSASGAWPEEYGRRLVVPPTAAKTPDYSCTFDWQADYHPQRQLEKNADNYASGPEPSSGNHTQGKGGMAL
jgi:hypothetical protein